MTDPRAAAAPQSPDESDPNGGGRDGLAGGMGVSSERVGKIRGSSEPATHGAEEIFPDLAPDDDPPPEQSADPSGDPGHLPR